MTEWYAVGMATLVPDNSDIRMWLRRDGCMFDIRLKDMEGDESLMIMGYDTARELFNLLGAMLGSRDFEGYRGITQGDD